LPLVGTIVKTVIVAPYQVKSIAEAVKLGKYDDHARNIPELFAEDEIGLTESSKVNFVCFNRNVETDEVLAWGEENKAKPILPKHAYGIGIQHPNEQCNAPIVALGSFRYGRVLVLYGDGGWRSLNCNTVRFRWPRGFLFGFVSK
jgi:hypothetical protein